MNIGYIRVSTKEQNLDRQIEKMMNEGIENRYIFSDKQSGSDFNREGYKAMKLILRHGDVLFIEDIDRLGRNFDLIIQEWQDIRSLGVDIVAINQKELFNSVNFKEMGDLGKFLENQLLSLFAYISSSERIKMLSRQKEGINKAKEKGIKLGRPPLLSLDKNIIKKWQEGKLTAVETYTKLGISKSSFYKYLKKNDIKKYLNSLKTKQPSI